jgi:hypothetical protein
VVALVRGRGRWTMPNVAANLLTNRFTQKEDQDDSAAAPVRRERG